MALVENGSNKPAKKASAKAAPASYVEDDDDIFAVGKHPLHFTRPRD
jgi:hypothetical protein